MVYVANLFSVQFREKKGREKRKLGKGGFGHIGENTPFIADGGTWGA